MLSNFLVRTLRYFLEKISPKKHKKKSLQKLLIIPLDHQFSVQQVFALWNWDSFKVWNVSFLKLSNFPGWKNSLEFLWCRYNSIPLCGTQLSILRVEAIMYQQLFFKSRWFFICSCAYRPPCQRPFWPLTKCFCLPPLTIGAMWMSWQTPVYH